MVAPAGIRVEGLNEFVRNLRRVDKELPQGMKAIHMELAEPVAQRAKNKARRKSGKMASTIKPQASARYARVSAGARIKYAGVQHYGWPAHNISPNPFLTDAITDLQPVIVVRYERLLGDWLEKVWQ